MASARRSYRRRAAFDHVLCSVCGKGDTTPHKMSDLKQTFVDASALFSNYTAFHGPALSFSVFVFDGDGERIVSASDRSIKPACR